MSVQVIQATSFDDVIESKTPLKKVENAYNFLMGVSFASRGYGAVISKVVGMVHASCENSPEAKKYINERVNAEIEGIFQTEKDLLTNTQKRRKRIFIKQFGGNALDLIMNDEDLALEKKQALQYFLS